MKLRLETLAIALTFSTIGCAADDGDDPFRFELSGAAEVDADVLDGGSDESGGSESGGDVCSGEEDGEQTCWSCGVYDEAQAEAEAAMCDADAGGESGGELPDETDSGEDPGGSESGGELPPDDAEPFPMPDGAPAHVDPYGLTDDDHATADKKGECYGAYPAGCQQLDGTRILQVRWMENFRHGTVSNPWVNAPGTFNQLTDAQEDQIVNACKDKPTVIEKVICAGHLVDVALDGTDDKNGTSVCRHHMAGLRAVLIKLGLGESATGSVTHAWNEIEIDTNGDGVTDTILIADSYNDIYYTVPK